MLYLLFILIILFFIFWYDVTDHLYGRKLGLAIICFFFILVSSLRFRIGGDALYYEDMYPNLPDMGSLIEYYFNANDEGFQPLWLLLVACCKSITEEYIFFQFVHSFLIFTLFFYFVIKNTNKPFTYILFFCLFHFYFYYVIEIQREVVAVLLFMINIKNLEHKKWIKYYAISIIAFLFHLSAIVLFLLPLIKLIRLTKRNVIIIIIISILLPLLKDFLLEKIQVFLFQENMIEKFDAYNQTQFNLNGIIFYYFIRTFLFFPILFLSFKLSLPYKSWFFVSYLVFSAVTPLINGSERFLNYFYFSYLVIIVDLIYNHRHLIINNIKYKVVIVSCMLNLFFVIDYKLFIIDNYGNHYYSLFYPYNSVLNSELNTERENFNDNVRR